IDVFRKQVTGQGIAPYLPVENQSALAAHIVGLANRRKTELSGAFIRENVAALVLDVKREERQIDEKDKEQIRQHDLIQRARQHQHEFCRALGSMRAYGLKIEELLNGWPKGLAFPVTGEFRNAVQTAKRVIDSLNSRI